MRDWSEIYKSDIKNFQEFCKLRNIYNDILMDENTKWKGNRRDVIEPKLGYSMGDTSNCILCVATCEEGKHHNCDACMWQLDDERKYRMYCLNASYIYGDLYCGDLEQTLEERVRLMDELIEEYYNLEETRP